MDAVARCRDDGRHGRGADVVPAADGAVGHETGGASKAQSGTDCQKREPNDRNRLAEELGKMSQYLAIVPVVCVWLGGLAAILAEAFRAPGERMPIGGLGIIGLAASAVSATLLWDRGAQSFGVVTADDFGLFVTLTLAVVGILTVALSSQIVKRDGIPAGEYYSLMLF